MAAAIAALASACSYPTTDSPYPGECAPLHPVAFVPSAFALAVPTDVALRVAFDDYPDPDTLRSNSLLLTTGYYWVPGTYGVDLIGKAAVVRPIRSLAAGLGYGFHLRPALASIAGCSATSEDIEFTTGDGPAGEPGPAPPPFVDVHPIFAARCGDGCHLATHAEGSGCTATPAGGLSLCARDAWDQMVGVRSHQTDSLRLVEPGDSARSYLLRKLLPATPAGGPIHGVYGQREPPGDPLPEAQLRLIAAWIDGGAMR